MKETINRHAPLPPGELGRRYRRLRHDDPGIEVVGCRIVEDDAPDCWDGYDPFDDYDLSTPDDEAELQLTTLVADFLHTPKVLPCEGIVAQALPLAEGETSVLASGGSLVERLADHIETLRSCRLGDTSQRERLRAAIQSWQAVEVLKREGERRRSTHFAGNVCLLHPFWIRSPATWNPAGATSLPEHVFAVYPVPAFLQGEWQRFDLRFKWIAWFILFAQGGSLKRAAEQFGWQVSPRLSQFFWDIEGLPPLQACLLAEVRRLGGTAADFHRLRQNPAFVFDPTEVPHDPHHLPFWRGTVQWIGTHRDALTDEACQDVLAWAMHEYTEARRAQTTFSWQRRTVAATLEHVRTYQRSLRRPYAMYRWQGHGLDRTYEVAGERWAFVELLSAEALDHEGQAMRHCVATYAGHCVSGLRAIVSAQVGGERRLTIELEPSTGRIFQARGVCNRNPTFEESSVVWQWRRDVAPTRTA